MRRRLAYTRALDAKRTKTTAFVLAELLNQDNDPRPASSFSFSKRSKTTARVF